MIMVGCPIKDRVEHVEGYIESLLNLDYDLKNLRVVMLSHGSTDGTLDALMEQRKQHRDKFGKFDVYMNNNIPKVDEMARDYSLFARIRNSWIGLRKREEYIFSVDSDVRIPSDSLKKLLINDKDICSIMLNNAPEEYEIYNFLNLGKDERVIRFAPSTPSLVRCDVTGAAYLINKSVLDSGVEYGFHPRGEDVYFCKKAREKGFKIYCDTRITAEHLMGDRNV